MVKPCKTQTWSGKAVQKSLALLDVQSPPLLTASRFLAEARDDRSNYFIKVKYMIKSYLNLDADVWHDDDTTYCTHRVTGTKTTLSSLFCRRMKCFLRLAYLGGNNLSCPPNVTWLETEPKVKCSRCYLTIYTYQILQAQRMAMLDRISVLGLVSEAGFEAEKCGHGGTSVFMLLTVCSWCFGVWTQSKVCLVSN